MDNQKLLHIISVDPGAQNAGGNSRWTKHRIQGGVGGVGYRDTSNLQFVLPTCFVIRWVNRKDPSGKNIFGGGFLGLDNIGECRSTSF